MRDQRVNLAIRKFIESRHFAFATTYRIVNTFIGDIVLPFGTRNVSRARLPTAPGFGPAVPPMTLGALTIEQRRAVDRRGRGQVRIRGNCQRYCRDHD